MGKYFELDLWTDLFQLMHFIFLMYAMNKSNSMDEIHFCIGLHI